MAIITDTWDADRYLHLALQETGYRQLMDGETSAACRKTAETFAKGDRRIMHIRLHQPFLPNWPQLAAARLDAWATPCITGWNPERLVRLAPIWQLRRSMTDSTGADLEAVRARALATIAQAQYSPQLMVELPTSALDSLHRAYVREAEQAGLTTAGGRSSEDALREAERLMAARVWTSPADTP
jgi:hypothetical protein